MARKTVVPQDEKQAKKFEEAMERRVEKAMPYDQFYNLLPELKVVSGLSGYDSDKNLVTIDPKYKLAVHEFLDGRQQTVPVLRADSYQELAHRYVFDRIHQVLEDGSLGHKIMNPIYSRNSGELQVDVVLDKSYKMDEKLFEKDWGIKYTDDDKKNKGVYRPIIRVRNSFIQSSEVQMGILRVVCSNGMIGLEMGKMSEPMKFTHIGQVMPQFNQSVDQLIASLFEKNVVENMMLRLEAQPTTLEAIVGWLIEYTGKEAATMALHQFGIAEKDPAEEVTKWIAYNMMTWAVSNALGGYNRRARAQRAIPQFLAA